MRDKALAWLYREIKRTRIALGLAAYPSGEADMLKAETDILEYLCVLVMKEE